MDMEIKFAIQDILAGATASERQALIDAENEFFGVDNLKLRQVINDLAYFISMCVMYRVINNTIVIDKNDPLYLIIGNTITSVDHLLAVIG